MLLPHGDTGRQFQLVNAPWKKLNIAGANPGTLARSASPGMVSRNSFQNPSVAAGLIPTRRSRRLSKRFRFLRTSRLCALPRWEAVRDAMPALFDVLAIGTEPAVRASWSLVNWLHHPFMDGNGRMCPLSNECHARVWWVSVDCREGRGPRSLPSRPGQARVLISTLPRLQPSSPSASDGPFRSYRQ